MNRIWIVTRLYVGGEQELLDVFRENVKETKIKDYICDEYYRKDNTYGEPIWENNRLMVTNIMCIEIALVEFTEIEN